MKKYKIKRASRGLSILLLMFGLLSFPSCDQDFGDINDSWDANLYEATIPGLFNGIVASLKKGDTRNGVPVSWLYQWNQQAAMFNSSGYRLDDKTTTAWSNYYRTLANARDLEILVADQEVPDNYTNILGMTKVVMAYKVLINTLLYGDMPYSEAGKGFLSTDFFSPVYESTQSIMEAAINDLTWAIDNFSTGVDQVALVGADMLLGNDIDDWKKFANSLRLRYAMSMQEVNSTFTDAIIADALTKPLLAPDEYVSLDPASIPNLENKRDGYWRGNSYVRMGSTMFGEMSNPAAVDGSGIYDLRCSILFEPNEDDEWVPYPQNPDSSVDPVTGNPHVPARVTTDWNANRSNFATFNVYYVNDLTIPQFLITGIQISFLKAEIYNRGLAGASADAAMAETNYLEGVTASVNYWYKQAFNSIWVENAPVTEAPVPADLTAMLTNTEVAYSAVAGDALSQIYKQSWIALFHQPFEAWTLQRRTNGTPNETLSATGLVVDFNRLTYPPSERETNRVNWITATSGADYSEKTKIWIQP